MRKAIAVAAALAALTFPDLVVAKVAVTPTPIVIDDDDGGGVDNFIMWYQRLRNSGTPVIVRGICVSACTFVLMLPKTQVCVEPTASLGFHLASANDKPLPELTAALIRRWYPLPVRKWLTDKDLGEQPIYMTAAEIVKLEIFPACEASE